MKFYAWIWVVLMLTGAMFVLLVTLTYHQQYPGNTYSDKYLLKKNNVVGLQDQLVDRQIEKTSSVVLKSSESGVNIDNNVENLGNYNNNVNNIEILNEFIGRDDEIRWRVFMDWALDSEVFGYVNYKALESIFTCYSHVQVTVMLTAPVAADYYKYGTLLSKHTFQKYQKLGFDVEVRPQLAAITSQPRYSSSSKFAYFRDTVDICCSQRTMKDIHKSRIIPFHLLFYIRMHNLAKCVLTRGSHSSVCLYADFNWFHRRGLDTLGISNGYILHRSLDCRSGNSKTPATLPGHFARTEILSEMELISCDPSMVMLFQPLSPVPECIMGMFENVDSQLVVCINADKSDDGIFCVEEALRLCFTQFNVTNDFFKASQRKSRFAVYSSSNMSNILRAMPSLDQRIDKTVLSKTAYQDASNLAMGLFYIGLVGWQPPDPNSPLANFISNVSDQLWLSATKLMRNKLSISTNSSIKLAEKIIDVERPLQCHIYDRNMQVPVVLPHQPSVRDRNNNWTAKYSNELTFQHHWQANASCALHFVIAGFMKAGTTYVYDLLAKHPQIIRNLKGVAFKETGCYLKNSLRANSRINRMNCFPFLERREAEVFAYGDGTVYYACRKEIPHNLQRDNPSVKVLMVLRNPVARAQSQHRFQYNFLTSKGLANMNELVLLALDPKEGNLNALYETAIRASQAAIGSLNRTNAINSMISLYHAGITGVKDSGKYKIAVNIIFHSLYAPALYYWKEVVFAKNPGQVMIVCAERLQQAAAKRPPGTKSLLLQLQDIHRFLGIRPMESVPVAYVHSTDMDVPLENQLNSSTRHALERFFKPFNDLVIDLVGESFGF